MKLILTSTGITHIEIENKLIELLDKDIKSTKIAFVKTASRTIEELNTAEMEKDKLINIGFLKDNISDYYFENSNNKNRLDYFDMLFVCGGNTFHLLNEINKNNYSQEIKNFILKDKLFIGISAGSIIVAPTIDIANVEPADINDVDIKDLTGLNIINFEVSPHSPEIVTFESVEKYAKDKKTKVWAFSDKSALVIKNKEYEIIGEKIYKVFDFKSN